MLSYIVFFFFSLIYIYTSPGPSLRQKWYLDIFSPGVFRGVCRGVPGGRTCGFAAPGRFLLPAGAKCGIMDNPGGFFEPHPPEA